MPQLHRHTDPRLRERRRRVLHEAARLMAEDGIRDYQQAKQKAARRLGIQEDAALPRNSEIEQALRDYQRLFRTPVSADVRRQRREAALQAAEFFEPFAARVLLQSLEDVESDAPIVLHLHSDDPQAVALFLQEHGIPTHSRMRRVRLDRARVSDVDSWAFIADGQAFELLVLPDNALRQAPLSAVDARPAPRYSVAQLRLSLQQN